MITHTHWSLKPADVLSRQGSTAELRLLAAEFTFLDEKLAALAQQAEDEATPAVALGTSSPAPTHLAASSTSSMDGDGEWGAMAGRPPVAAVGSGGLVLQVEDMLASLANDIPDLRQRVGVP